MTSSIKNLIAGTLIALLCLLPQAALAENAPSSALTSGDGAMNVTDTSLEEQGQVGRDQLLPAPAPSDTVSDEAQVTIAQDDQATVMVDEIVGDRPEALGEQAAAEPDAVAAAPGGGRAVEAESSAPALEGSAHVQRMGWVRGAASADGTLTLGTTGMALRLEAIRLAVAGAPAGSVSVRAHVQTYGWRPYAPDGAGTTGESKRLEAVRIRLEGELARDWSVQYRVHSQTLGWLGWAADGQAAGTGGMSKRLESVQVRLVPAGAPLPAGGDAYVDAGLSAEAHVQGVGWQGARRGMDVTVGTSGQSRRMEALRLSRPSFDLSGDVECQAHVQGIGWQGWVGSGRVAGTTGQGRRVEAVRVRLTEELDSHYDVWYRLHVQGLGWMAWAHDGEAAGTAGLSLRVEAAQVALVPEGAPAPPADGQAASVAFAGPGALRAQVSGADGSWTPWDSSGSALSAGGALRRLRAELSGPLPGGVRVEAHSARRGWQGAVASGEAAGDAALDLQAVRISLTGEASRAYSVWYRAEVEGLGWTGWARDGAEAGSVGLGRPVVALQACLRSRAQGAPGPTEMTCARRVSGDADLDVIINKTYRDVTGTGDGALKRAYDYVKGFTYRKQNEWPAGSWTTWSVPYAKEMYNVGSGNCYRSASLMCWLARGLGYDASVYSGRCPSISGGLTAHSWVEIRQDGITYILDANMERSYPERNWFWRTYEDAPMAYYR